MLLPRVFCFREMQFYGVKGIMVVCLLELSSTV